MRDFLVWFPVIFGTVMFIFGSLKNRKKIRTGEKKVVVKQTELGPELDLFVHKGGTILAGCIIWVMLCIMGYIPAAIVWFGLKIFGVEL